MPQAINRRGTVALQPSMLLPGVFVPAPAQALCCFLFATALVCCAVLYRVVKVLSVVLKSGPTCGVCLCPPGSWLCSATARLLMTTSSCLMSARARQCPWSRLSMRTSWAYPPVWMTATTL